MEFAQSAIKAKIAENSIFSHIGIRICKNSFAHDFLNPYRFTSNLLSILAALLMVPHFNDLLFEMV